MMIRGFRVLGFKSIGRGYIAILGTLEKKMEKKLETTTKVSRSFAET